jgi:hypothetical protein
VKVIVTVNDDPVATPDSELAIVVDGPVWSDPQLNVLETMLPLPAASVNEFAITDTDVEPSADGVKVAVYTDVVVEAKLDKVPPLTVMSPTTKSAVGSLDVNVSAIEASFVVEPEETSSDEINIVNAVES